MTLLIYPAKGIIKRDKSGAVTKIKCEEAYEVLGDNGVELYKEIFDNNNKQLVERFFSDCFIKRLWPMIQAELRFEHCFNEDGSHLQIKSTYKSAGNMVKGFGVELPKWWNDLFDL